PFCHRSPPAMGLNHVLPLGSTYRAPGLCDFRPGIGKVTNGLSRKRSRPCVCPTQMFPSLSSKSALTAPPTLLVASDETPSALNRSNPLGVPIQTLVSRSRIMDKTSTRRRAEGTPDRVSSLPFQRKTPLLVPIRNSRFSTGSKQVIFL